jgi:hypothetical protein
MAEAVAAGAFVSVNHPKPFGPPWEYPTVRSFHAVEVWNGPWAVNALAVEFWESRLRAGARLTAVGGSDTHLLRARDPDARHSQRLGMPTTWVDAGARLDPDTILDALRGGRTFVSASPAGPQLYLEPGGDGARVSVRGGGGAVLALVTDVGRIAGAVVTDADEWNASYTIPRDARYVRAELANARGEMQALTSPLWRR